MEATAQETGTVAVPRGPGMAGGTRPKTASTGAVAAANPAQPWVASFLADDQVDARMAARRAAVGFGLAAVYGVALGLGRPAADLARATLTLLSLPAAVMALALPALYIVLALLDAPLGPTELANHASHSVFRMGLLLAGGAPALALYGATTHPGIAFGVGMLGLYLTGLTCLWGLARRVCAAFGDGRAGGLLVAGRMLSVAAFMVFSVALVLRLSRNFAGLGSVS